MDLLSLEQFAQFQSDDERTFNRIFPELKEFIYVIAKKILKHTEDAEDVTAGVLFTIWEKREGIKSPKHLYTFLYVTTRNRCFNFLKKKKTNACLSNTDVDKLLEQEGVEDHFWEVEEIKVELAYFKSLIIDEIAGFPSKLRKIFELWFLEGRSRTDIASQLEISPKTVDTQLKIGTEKIKNKLVKGGYTLLLFLFLLIWIFLLKRSFFF